MAPEQVRILALGSPHGDDQVGWLVADALAVDPHWASRVHKLAHPLELIERLQDDCATLILDACRSGAPIGTVLRFDADTLDELPAGRVSTHGASLTDALRLARTLRRLPETLVILAVEIADSRPGGELTEAGRNAVQCLEQQARRELGRLPWNSAE